MGNSLTCSCNSTDPGTGGHGLPDTPSRLAVASPLPKSKPIIYDVFQHVKVLGDNTSMVYEVENIQTKEHVALKVNRKREEGAVEEHIREVELLQELDHPNILRFRGAWEDNDTVAIATSLLTGGTLVRRVRQGIHYSERVAAMTLSQIVAGLKYAHELNIVHRDIRLENIVFEDESEDSRPVIIDWDRSERIMANQVYTNVVGSRIYLAPENRRQRMGHELKKSDMWAVGVTAFIMLVGKPPFQGSNMGSVMSRVLKEEVVFPIGVDLSQEAKSFIRGCLKKRTDARLSASEALETEFLKRAEEMPNVQTNMLFTSRFAIFNKATEIQQILVNVEANQLSDREKDELREMFEELDKMSSDKKVDEADLAKYLANMNPYDCDEAHLENARRILEAAGKRELDKKTMAKNRAAQKMTSEAYMKEIFAAVDADHDGTVTVSEFKAHVAASLDRDLTKAESRRIQESFVNQFGDRAVTEKAFVDSMVLDSQVVTPKAEAPKVR